jgi:hypothetical protein
MEIHKIIFHTSKTMTPTSRKTEEIRIGLAALYLSGKMNNSSPTDLLIANIVSPNGSMKNV